MLTCADRCLDEMVAGVSTSSNTENNRDDDMDNEDKDNVTEIPPTRSQLLDSIHLLQRYFSTLSEVPNDVFLKLNSLENVSISHSGNLMQKNE